MFLNGLYHIPHLDFLKSNGVESIPGKPTVERLRFCHSAFADGDWLSAV